MFKSNKRYFNKFNKSFIIISMIMVMAVVIIVGSAATKGGSADASTVKEKYFTCIEIKSGDTLWGIAEEYATPEYKSYKVFIDEVKSINNLTSDKITSGMNIVIPIYK